MQFAFQVKIKKIYIYRNGIVVYIKMKMVRNR